MTTIKTTKKQAAINERNENIDRLNKLLDGNKTIYTTVKQVSSSGMSRHICVYIAKDNQIINITYYVAKILDYRINRNTGGLVVGGCGMDMGFAVVYSLGRAMRPDGFKLEAGHHGRNGDKSGFDKDGGYYFNQQWM
jgi:hypothetical protein